MKLLQRLCLVLLLVSGMALAQTAATPPDSSNIVNQIQQLQQAMAEQQKEMAAQQKKIAEQQQQLEQLQQQLAAQLQPVAASGEQTPHLVNAVLTPAGRPAAAPQEKPKESPLSFRIGGAEFTPGGYMDFATFFRSTNTGNTGGTSFNAIPFSNTIGGHLTETRLSAQRSLVSLKVTDKFGKNDVTGYMEMDFLGNDAANVEVSANSHTFRQRLYFLDLKRDKWEFLGGQAWSMLTPNRRGLSPMPADVFITMNEDFNYQVGLTWTRAPQFRAVYHPNDNWAIGFAMENPQQYVGAGEVIFPFAFNAQLGPQFDAANNAGTPNAYPDFIVKTAYDTDVNGKHFHAEVGGLATSVKITDLASGNFVHHVKMGGGVEAALNLEVVKNFRFVANAFYGNGGGRYMFGMAPGAVIYPNAAGTDVGISLVHSGAGLAGFEYQATPKTLITGYYGGWYAQRNSFPDWTSGVVGPCSGKPCVGFGGLNSPNSSNKSIQEATLGWTQTFWKNPQYGTLMFVTQGSYLSRSPWFVAAGAPKNAHLFMAWTSLRYVLP